tara:strand:- start:161 stop:481 length:321 start_codon:yes stop_codon:yes gene_type:complete
MRKQDNQEIENGVSEIDIPILTDHNTTKTDFFQNALSVTLDNCKAVVLISSFSHQSQKIVIKLLEHHPVLSERSDDNVFMTKYYKIDRPGILEWGYDEKPVIIKRQ